MKTKKNLILLSLLLLLLSVVVVVLAVVVVIVVFAVVDFNLDQNGTKPFNALKLIAVRAAFKCQQFAG